jgi:hypothetical protein
MDYEALDWDVPMMSDEGFPPGNCDNCHGYPPPDAGTHGGGTQTDCSSCHGDVVNGDDQTFADKELHIDGELSATGFCNSCHGWPPFYVDAGNYDQKGLVNSSNALGKGGHWNSVTNGAHIDNGTLPDPTTATYGTGITQCFQCHPMADVTHPENDGSVDVGFGLGSQPAMANSFDGTGEADYGGVSTEDTTPKTCSNVNCHFGKETPKWDCP